MKRIHRSILTFLFRAAVPAVALAAFATAAERPLRGDLDGNGRVEAADLAILHACLTGMSPLPRPVATADLDGDGRLSAADATRLQLGLAHPPQALPDAVFLSLPGPLRIHPLANDISPLGQPLRLVTCALPEHGRVTVNADGTLTYAGADGFSGTDTFSYTVQDGMGGASAGEVRVTFTRPPLTLAGILAELRADPAGTVRRYAADGWPLPVEGKMLFVNLDTGLDRMAGDLDGWAGTPMTLDTGFRWLHRAAPPGTRYKFTDGSTWAADPWGRFITQDAYGEMTHVRPAGPHLEKLPGVSGNGLLPRTLRVWVPEGAVRGVLYMHDGQNLFNPAAFWGGWRLQESVPPGVMIVGIDNTAERIDEYTPVTDFIYGQTMGGRGDDYADFVEGTVREQVRDLYGEPWPAGVMGSSLGGLISLHLADRHAGLYAFAGSLSGTLGWGSIGSGVHNETLIQRLPAHGHRATVLYADSGGNGPCADLDGDGIADDTDASDNYCENVQLRDALVGAGYRLDRDLFYFWDADAPHNEAAWGDRVWRPFAVFSALCDTPPFFP